ncbi:MAG: hypothetical protein JW776_04520 [Candidatus Lokiarchaeota archaeon]|nr:hypothetical protein [Candidatus Lokiarchaeota archaeon]
MANKLGSWLIESPFRIETDKKKHLKTVKIGFFISFFYSIVWGIYEYYIMKSGIVPNMIPQIAHWAMMHLLLIVILAFTTKFSLEQIIMGQFFMAVFEDLMYFITLWIDTGNYPYPYYNWWDEAFASFRVLGGLGQPIPFLPYIPIYYIPGFIIIVAFYICSFSGAKSSRTAAWLIIPFYLGVLIGTMVGDLVALILLIVVPIGLYIYLGAVFFVRKKNKM